MSGPCHLARRAARGGGASGTAALEIVLRSIGVAGRDVVVPANTFFATAEAVLRAGGRPVFADIDSGHFRAEPRRRWPRL